jgi:hypothetical protein
MKQYSVDIQVDFDEPRVMPPRKRGRGAWRAVGYFRYFYCSDGSKDKAKQMVLDFARANEADPETCRFRCDRIAWMRGLTSMDQIGGGLMESLTGETFERRHECGIWCDSGQHYYVSDADAAASWTNEDL